MKKSQSNSVYIILIILSLVLGITVIATTAVVVSDRLGERAARSAVSQTQTTISPEEPSIPDVSEPASQAAGIPNLHGSASPLADGTVRLPLYAVLLSGVLYLVLFVVCIVLAVQLSAAKRQSSEEIFSVPPMNFPAAPAPAAEDPFAAYEDIYDE